MITNLRATADDGRLRSVQLMRWDMGESINAFQESKRLENYRIAVAAMNCLSEQIGLSLRMLGGMAGEW